MPSVIRMQYCCNAGIIFGSVIMRGTLICRGSMAWEWFKFCSILAFLIARKNCGYKCGLWPEPVYSCMSGMIESEFELELQENVSSPLPRFQLWICVAIVHIVCVQCHIGLILLFFYLLEFPKIIWLFPLEMQDIIRGFESIAKGCERSNQSNFY